LLILIDLMMPIMDGIEFIRQKDLRSNLAGIPVCIMTASALPQVDFSGIVTVLRKPFDLEALMSLVERYR
jgi:CheY-like chemotaxis protein